MAQVRVRFAPSPTGPLHIGGVRTALFNYLFAKKNNGSFILRIEDTDRARLIKGAEQYISESLRWCGITVDEGVNEGGTYASYRQSERIEIYRKYIGLLVNEGYAYYAFDTPEQLDNMRRVSEKSGQTFMYNASARAGLTNSISLDEATWKKKLENGDPYVIRFRMPENEDIHFNDIIRGNMTVNTGTLDDKILFKSDGFPTYHLANVVDDHLMKISHVIRGEEWLPSLPLHIMLYRSFGWELPLFAHLPLILKPNGKGKLSKRDGERMGFPVYPLFWPYGETAKGFREEGYYPEAFINMIALLGWNPGSEREIFPMEDLVKNFSLEKVGKSGSKFDPVKAKWFNHHYLQERSNNQLAIEFREILRAQGYHFDIFRLEILIDMVKERVSFVRDIWEETDFFFRAPEVYDEKVVRKRWNSDSPRLLKEMISLLEGSDDFSSAAIETKVKEWIKEEGHNTGLVMNLLRLVVVGELRGPHIFDITGWLGKTETVSRIRKGIDEIGKQVR